MWNIVLKILNYSVSTPMICGIWVQFPPTPLVPITLNWFESALRLPLHLI